MTYYETLQQVEAEWYARCEGVKREADYWRQRHDAVVDMMIKNTLLMAQPQPMMLADTESFNAGKALADRQMMQLFTDPENQPTQHGTVTVEYMQREIAAECEACAYRAGIALLGADRGLANRVDQAIRARGQA
jgi:hypothetical protein